MAVSAQGILPAALASPELCADFEQFERWSLSDKPRVLVPLSAWTEFNSQVAQFSRPEKKVALVCFSGASLREQCDSWMETEDSWIRMHQIPRRGFFTPGMTADGPDRDSLEGSRVTEVILLHDGSRRQFTDNLDDPSSTRVLSRSRRGSTRFPKGKSKSQIIPSCGKQVRFDPQLDEGAAVTPAVRPSGSGTGAVSAPEAPPQRHAGPSTGGGATRCAGDPEQAIAIPVNKKPVAFAPVGIERPVAGTGEAGHRRRALRRPVRRPTASLPRPRLPPRPRRYP